VLEYKVVLIGSIARGVHLEKRLELLVEHKGNGCRRRNVPVCIVHHGHVGKDGQARWEGNNEQKVRT
jgi:hypothetical protein